VPSCRNGQGFDHVDRDSSMDHSLACTHTRRKDQRRVRSRLVLEGTRQSKVSISGVLINSLHLVTGMGCLHLGFLRAEESVEDEQNERGQDVTQVKEDKRPHEVSHPAVHSGPLVKVGGTHLVTLKNTTIAPLHSVS
jgi:hypothetical protein